MFPFVDATTSRKAAKVRHHQVVYAKMVLSMDSKKKDLVYMAKQFSIAPPTSDSDALLLLFALRTTILFNNFS